MSWYRERGGSYGPIGNILIGELDRIGLNDSFRELSLTQQVLSIGTLQQNHTMYSLRGLRLQGLISDSGNTDRIGTAKTVLALAAVGTHYPIQVKDVRGDLTRELRAMVDKYWASREQSVMNEERAAPSGTGDKPGCWMAAARQTEDAGKRSVEQTGASKSTIEAHFPHKPWPQAATKANVRLKDLLISLSSLCSYRVNWILDQLAGRASDDQACAALLYSYAARSHLGETSCYLAVLSIIEPEYVKGLSSLVKALGLQSSAAGSHMVELGCLLGRGTAQLDLAAEGSRRCDAGWVSSQVVDVDQRLLGEAVGRILTRELEGRKLDFLPLDKFWDTRWAWCVNGAHNTAKDAALGVGDLKAKPGIDRVYRRQFAEACVDEPVSAWDGKVSCGASMKLEHGKSRAIFACDTISYFAFEHFLRPVEKAWQHRRVILDPGRFGAYGMVSKVRAARRKGQVNLMLDYDDFNSQHSTESMQTVIRVACDLTGYDRKLGENLINSFSNTWMRCPSGERRVLGTLMSGHRGTTFINSVLNAAYIEMAVGSTRFSNSATMHVGDDVYCSLQNVSDAEEFLTKCGALGLRMNPAKQSLGTCCAEFLRTAITEGEACGYVARSIASTISGNWVTDMTLGPEECLKSMLSNCRALINRSRGASFGALLSRSVANVTRLKAKHVARILSGEVGLNEGPVFSSQGYLERMTLKVVEEDLHHLDTVGLPEEATVSYLTRAAADVELKALKLAGKSVKSAMLDSSYRKALSGGDLRPEPTIVLKGSRPMRLQGMELIEDLIYRPPAEGLLSKYPLLHLLRDNLTKQDTTVLIGYVGGQLGAGDLEVQAWGRPCRSIVVDGFVDYATASSFSRRMETDVMKVIRPLYF